MNIKDTKLWVETINKVLLDKSKKNASIEFHNTIYEALGTKNQTIIDTIFNSFLHPFDSGTMQACITVLGGCPFDLYIKSYIKLLPKLLKEQPCWATDLLDYPGRDLTPSDARNIKAHILSFHGDYDTVRELMAAIAEQGLDNEEPWSFFTI